MAECNDSRCSHDRRMFRKELHKWSKEILYLLGLERLAEELMGTWKWKILIQPFTDLESKNPIDWYPEETCYFCCAKKLPPYDPASGIIPTIDSYSSLQIDTDEHSSNTELKVSGSFTCSSALSAWDPSALFPSISKSFTSDQPLDLSIGNLKQPALDQLHSSFNETIHSSHKNDEGVIRLRSVLKVPQIPLKQGICRRADTNSKRSYTEDELQAALRDIQSGKLGTRRAAVIYGIPRSTLRNKVYKLANESKNRAHSRMTHSVENYKKTDKIKNLQQRSGADNVPYDGVQQQNISSASESLRQLLKHTITQKVQCSTASSENLKQSLSFDSIDSMSQLQMLGNLDCSQKFGPILSHMFSDIQNLALFKSKENFECRYSSLNALKEEIKLPLLPDLIRRLAEERLELEKDIHKDSEAIEEDESVEISSASTQSNVILKVPSFKPAKSSLNSDLEIPSSCAISSSPPPVSSHSISGNRGIAVSLKELIARSLSQRVSYHLKDEPTFEYPFCESNVKNQGVSCPWISENSSKVEKGSSLNNANNSSNSSDGIKLKKRTRPKRGRYRNYDRDNLARAVRAVQKGEMSVHRAGTFYGVPHSTLEYKVKERHLLRSKKRDGINNSLLNDASEPDSTSKKIQANSEENNISLKNLKSNFSLFESSSDTELSHRPIMDSYPSPLSIWQTLPFLSLDFAQIGSSKNFFASQMMRKLQENAKSHEETQLKQKKDLGMLETLIKSTLEKTVISDSKSTLIFSEATSTQPDPRVSEDVDE